MTLLFIAFFININCNDHKKVAVESGNAIQSSIVITNQKPDSMEALYLPGAMLIKSQNEIIYGAKNIANQKKTECKNLKKAELLYSIAANQDSSIYYQITKLSCENDQSYARILILNGPSGNRKIELEFISPLEVGFINEKDQLDQRRQEWIKKCNAHSAADLINNLYAKEAIYFNYKPLVIGRAAITNEYSYMNNNHYSLHLEPLKVVQINNNIAFEIGQCSGSYQGKYLIVWQKNMEGKWYVLLDSNI